MELLRLVLFPLTALLPPAEYTYLNREKGKESRDLEEISYK